MEEEKKAAGIIAPIPGNILVASTSNTGAAIDLSSCVGRFVTVSCQTTEVYIKCDATSATADDVDDTATTGNNRAVNIPAASSVSFIVDGNYPYLGYKTASSTGTIRIWVSSKRS
jgi:hypothetical protein